MSQDITVNHRQLPVTLSFPQFDRVYKEHQRKFSYFSYNKWLILLAVGMIILAMFIKQEPMISMVILALGCAVLLFTVIRYVIRRKYKTDPVQLLEDNYTLRIKIPQEYINTKKVKIDYKGGDDFYFSVVDKPLVVDDVPTMNIKLDMGQGHQFKILSNTMFDDISSDFDKNMFDDLNDVSKSHKESRFYFNQNINNLDEFNRIFNEFNSEQLQNHFEIVESSDQNSVLYKYNGETVNNGHSEKYSIEANSLEDFERQLREIGISEQEIEQKIQFMQGFYSGNNMNTFMKMNTKFFMGDIDLNEYQKKQDWRNDEN